MVIFLLALVAQGMLFSVQDFAPTVSYLASDRLEGRRAGTPWADTAAVYLSRQLKEAGIQPVFQDSYFQPFTVHQVEGYDTATTVLELISGEDTLRLYPGKDFVPLAFSGSADTTGALLFAGYGITSMKHHYDDYHGSDPTWKVVVVLRHEPREKDSTGVFGTPFPSMYSDLRYKARNAREHGAAALILVKDGVPHPDEKDDLLPFRHESSVQDVGIPVVQVLRKHLTSFLNLDSLQQAIDQDLNPHPAMPGIQVRIRVRILKRDRETRNVVGLIPGTDPKAKTYQVIGAHYDHLGWGGPGSGALDPDTHAIHNGADDNASGVAMTLAVARYLRKHPLRHPVLVAFWSAEEIGALGSDYFVKHPPVPLKNIRFYLNFDMVGRLTDSSGLFVTGTGTARELDSLSKTWGKQTDLRLTFSPEGFGGSDHMNFYLGGIPVLFFFTGMHEDYHKHTDDADKINYNGMARIASFALKVLHQVDTLNTLTYQETQAKGAVSGIQTGETRRGVRLGVIPDYAFSGKGMRLSGVRKNGPGGRAGLKKGDILIAINGKTIDDIYAYMYALQEVDWGDTLHTRVVRDQDTLNLDIPLIQQGGK